MNARTVFSVFYGIEIKPHDDPYVVLSEKPLLEAARGITTSHGLVVRTSLAFSPLMLMINCVLEHIPDSATPPCLVSGFWV
jgi:hypothetical protein